MSAEDGESMISCLQEKSYSFRLLEEGKGVTTWHPNIMQ